MPIYKTQWTVGKLVGEYAIDAEELPQDDAPLPQQTYIKKTSYTKQGSRLFEKARTAFAPRDLNPGIESAYTSHSGRAQSDFDQDLVRNLALVISQPHLTLYTVSEYLVSCGFNIPLYTAPTLDQCQRALLHYLINPEIQTTLTDAPLPPPKPELTQKKAELLAQLGQTADLFEKRKLQKALEQNQGQIVVTQRQALHESRQRNLTTLLEQPVLRQATELFEQIKTKYTQNSGRFVQMAFAKFFTPQPQDKDPDDDASSLVQISLPGTCSTGGFLLNPNGGIQFIVMGCVDYINYCSHSLEGYLKADIRWIEKYRINEQGKIEELPFEVEIWGEDRALLGDLFSKSAMQEHRNRLVKEAADRYYDFTHIQNLILSLFSNAGSCTSPWLLKQHLINIVEIIGWAISRLDLFPSPRALSLIEKFEQILESLDDQIRPVLASDFFHTVVLPLCRSKILDLKIRLLKNTVRTYRSDYSSLERIIAPLSERLRAAATPAEILEAISQELIRQNGILDTDLLKAIDEMIRGLITSQADIILATEAQQQASDYIRTILTQIAVAGSRQAAPEARTTPPDVFADLCIYIHKDYTSPNFDKRFPLQRKKLIEALQMRAFECIETSQISSNGLSNYSELLNSLLAPLDDTQSAKPHTPADLELLNKRIRNIFKSMFLEDPTQDLETFENHINTALSYVEYCHPIMAHILDLAFRSLLKNFTIPNRVALRLYACWFKSQYEHAHIAPDEGESSTYLNHHHFLMCLAAHRQFAFEYCARLIKQFDPLNLFSNTISMLFSLPACNFSLEQHNALLACVTARATALHPLVKHKVLQKLTDTYTRLECWLPIEHIPHLSILECSTLTTLYAELICHMGSEKNIDALPNLLAQRFPLNPRFHQQAYLIPILGLMYLCNNSELCSKFSSDRLLTIITELIFGAGSLAQLPVESKINLVMLLVPFIKDDGRLSSILSPHNLSICQNNLLAQTTKLSQELLACEKPSTPLHPLRIVSKLLGIFKVIDTTTNGPDIIERLLRIAKNLHTLLQSTPTTEEIKHIYDHFCTQFQIFFSTLQAMSLAKQSDQAAQTLSKKEESSLSHDLLKAIRLTQKIAGSDLNQDQLEPLIFIKRPEAQALSVEGLTLTSSANL